MPGIIKLSQVVDDAQFLVFLFAFLDIGKRASKFGSEPRNVTANK